MRCAQLLIMHFHVRRNIILFRVLLDLNIQKFMIGYCSSQWTGEQEQVDRHAKFLSQFFEHPKSRALTSHRESEFLELLKLILRLLSIQIKIYCFLFPSWKQKLFEWWIELLFASHTLGQVHSPRQCSHLISATKLLANVTQELGKRKQLHLILF